jgi:dTDP-4-amino-4,6-dideoxygalactose transaminase
VSGAVPYVDLRAAHTELAAELDAAWRRVASSGRFVLGPEVEAFEHAFAAYCGAAHCIGVGNGLELLSVKLRHLDAWNARRGAAASRYLELLRDLPPTLPAVAASCDPVWHLFVVRTRERVAGALRAGGIETLVHYPVPPHRQPAYADLDLGDDALPIAAQLAREVLSLPLWPQMSVEQQAHVADALARTLRA